MKRTAFFISDGTGITAETLGHSLLSQFENIDFDQVTLPYINNEKKAYDTVKRINQVAAKDGTKPIIFDTIINHNIRDIVATCEGFMVDIFTTFLRPLEQELQVSSSYTVGKSHSIVNEAGYKVRIDAINFSMANDDGGRVRHYDQADIILTGVSRSGKTPACLYLALQFGLNAANYPLTEDDLEDETLPAPLKAHQDKLFGLTIDPGRLSVIRHERKAHSRYSSPRQCQQEIRGAEAIFNRENIPFIDVSELSVEEISTRILAQTGLERRLRS